MRVCMGLPFSSSSASRCSSVAGDPAGPLPLPASPVYHNRMTCFRLLLPFSTSSAVGEPTGPLLLPASPVESCTQSCESSTCASTCRNSLRLVASFDQPAANISATCRTSKRVDQPGAKLRMRTVHLKPLQLCPLAEYRQPCQDAY